ncbi:hypothetical protein BDW71DRAFT_183704, partial [Aspergillus fruticulosus]
MPFFLRCSLMGFTWALTESLALLQLFTATQRIMSTISPCIGSTFLCHCHLLRLPPPHVGIPFQPRHVSLTLPLSCFIFPVINRRFGLFHACIP